MFKNIRIWPHFKKLLVNCLNRQYCLHQLDNLESEPELKRGSFDLEAQFGFCTRIIMTHQLYICFILIEKTSWNKIDVKLEVRVQEKSQNLSNEISNYQNSLYKYISMCDKWRYLQKYLYQFHVFRFSTYALCCSNIQFIACKKEQMNIIYKIKSNYQYQTVQGSICLIWEYSTLRYGNILFLDVSNWNISIYSVVIFERFTLSKSR